MATNYSGEEKICFPYEYGGQTIMRELEFSGEFLNRAVKTPARMVKFEGAQSTVAGFEDHTVLSFMEYGISRETNPTVSVGYQGDGTVRLNNIIFAIPYDDSIPTLTMKLRRGEPFVDMSFKTLMWSGGESPEVLTEHVFGNVYLIGWYPGRFVHVFVARAEEWLLHANSFSQVDATNKGNNADQFNFRTNSDAVGITAAAGGGGEGGGGGEEGAGG